MKLLKPAALSLLLAAFSFTCHPALAATTSELLQRGLYAEEVEGNLESAIDSYNQIIRNPSAPPNHVAQALFRQGTCYLKLKDEASARAALEKLVANYPGQTGIVEKALPLLDELTEFDPAALMPPGTLAYVEFGSPGRQIETVLSSLKGTPFENPLAAMTNQPAVYQKSPGDILAALLNPSMMAEFKKIRSTAFGITGVGNNTTPSVAVLYPGKSDALRGLILAGLGVAGRPGPTIEGMQTVNIHLNPRETAAVAYDDRVIIAAQPASQLEWSVKQYKRRSSEPTLASGNKSFAKLSRAQRQNNVLTAWVNVDDAYAQLIKLFPPDRVPAELRQANAFADLEHIDDLVITDSIEPGGANCRIEVSFKEGYHSVAYDIFRTARLNRTALQAVPAEAIAVVSVSLDQKSAALNKQFAPAFNVLAGMGVGPETLADLQQVTLFVLPGVESAISPGSLFPPERLGLAITSRNPDQTRRVLARLLGTAEQMSSGRTNTDPRQFKVATVNGRDLFCYLEQVNGNVLLSVNRSVINASIAAINNGRSVNASGPLHDAVSRMTPGDNKVVLLNAGGIASLFGAQQRGFSENEAALWRSALDQLSASLAATTVELRTEEESDHLTLSYCLKGIPPAKELFAPAIQIAGLLGRARERSSAGDPGFLRTATVPAAPKAPVIDGQIDAAWDAARRYPLEKVSYQRPASASDCSARFGALWDADNLYVLVDVTDDALKHHSAADRWYESDSVEVYFDADNAKAGQYGQNDFQYAFSWDRTSPSMQEIKRNQTNGIRYAMVTTDKGYRLEARFPWSTVAGKPAAGGRIGLDVHANDSDVDGKRESKLTWHDPRDDAWENTRAFGVAELAGLVGWWKFDETQGKSAADSSGGNHAGSLVGHAKWARGRIGGAIDLDGAGSYVRVAGKSAFDFGGEATVACWVNLRSVPAEWTAIVSKGDTAWRLSSVEKNQQFHFGVGDFNQFGNEVTVNGASTVGPNEWHHVAGVYNGSTLSVYLDGRPDGPPRPCPHGIGRNDFDVLIGENAEQSSRCFDGLIDELRVYNYALTEAQIKALAAGQ